jgi:hypothetical protein
MMAINNANQHATGKPKDELRQVTTAIRMQRARYVSLKCNRQRELLAQWKTHSL